MAVWQSPDYGGGYRCGILHEWSGGLDLSDHISIAGKNNIKAIVKPLQERKGKRIRSSWSRNGTSLGKAVSQ